MQAVAPSLARTAARDTLGTFHEREGVQAYASRAAPGHAGWGRTFGGNVRQSWAGDVSPSFDGDVWGFQAGAPLLAFDHDDGQKDRIGAFLGYSTIGDDVKAYAIGRLNRAVGSVDIDAYSLGAYWTHFWPSGAYADTVLMQSWLDYETRSVRTATDTDGAIMTASLEVGYPLSPFGAWIIEPQAQLIFQHQSVDALADRFSAIAYEDDSHFTGRIGARLSSQTGWASTRLRPYLLVNLWRGFDDGVDMVYFNAVPISNERAVTAVEIGGGFSADLDGQSALFGKLSYTTDIDSTDLDSVSGKAGLRIAW